MWQPLAFLDKVLGFSQDRWGHWARLNWPRQHSSWDHLVLAHPSSIRWWRLTELPVMEGFPSFQMQSRASSLLWEGGKLQDAIFCRISPWRGQACFPKRLPESLSFGTSSPLARLLRASPAVVCVGEGCAYLRNTRSLHPLLSPAHVNPRLGAAFREVWWMRVSSDAYWFIFFFPNTHSLCWVTHGCHLFKKSSTWIYTVTSGSGSQHPCNGEGWLLKMLTGIKRKGN